MKKNTLQWVGIALLISILGGFLGWYIFISRKQGALDFASLGRGFSADAPTGSAGGSMRENLVTFFNSPIAQIESAISGRSATSTPAAQPEEPHIYQVSPVPGAGLASFLVSSGTSSVTVLRFVERPSGNVFEVPVAGGQPRRLTNTLVPRVHEAFWIDEDSLVIRHADDDGITVRTLIADIKSASSSEDVGELSGTYLDGDTRSVAVHPNGTEPSLFYLASGEQGTFGIRSKGDGTEPKRVWSSPLRGWRMSWLADNAVALSQGAAQGIIGSAYSLSLVDGSLSLLIGNRRGLSVAKHPTSDAIAFSTSVNGRVQLFVRDDKVDREMPVVTFADKCIWGRGDNLFLYCAVPRSLPTAQLPDAWYRGEVAFNDRWYVVDVVGGSAEEMLTTQEAENISIDVIDPALDASGERVFFTDARTGTLWVIKI